MEELAASAFAMAPMAPGIYHEEQEDHETKNQKDHRRWLLFPERPATSGEFLEVHAEVLYTSLSRNPSPGRRGLFR